MTNQEAKRILVEKGFSLTESKIAYYLYEDEFDDYRVYLHKDCHPPCIKLQMFVTPEQLEAIAQWMRDPVGVMNAEDV